MATSSTRRRRGVPAPAPATTATAEAALRAELDAARNDLGLLARRLEDGAAGGNPFTAGTREAVADLERAIIADPGWRLFTTLSQQEFSAEGMRQLRAVCRLMAVANPLIKRGLNLRSFYVWGQGCELVARANGKARKGRAGGAGKEQDVQAVIKAMVDDPANQREVFGAQARDELEHALGTDGEIYCALFTRPASGWVQARTIIADEIAEVITDPDDAATPWFYRRVWTRNAYDPNGRPVPTVQELLYPDVDYKPTRRPRTFGGVQIQWDAPIVAVQVNRPRGWLRGVPDAYAAVNWARAWKEFLEQWAGLMKSLARFAWRLTAEGRDRQQARAALNAAAAGNTATTPGTRSDVGGVALTPLQGNLEAIPKTGATIDAESGRPLAMMVAAALDIPVTMLLADPGQTGARATAETLDWPTELAMMARRSLWTAFQLRIVQHRITEAVRAPQGPLKGTVKRDPVTGREVVTLDGDTDTTVDVVWPDLDETEPKALIDAVVAAAGTGTMPPELVLRHLLQALGVREAESLLDDMIDDDGAFKWPQPPPMGGPGGQAAALARAGGDPAAAGAGPMGPDGQPADGVPPPVAGVGGEAAARQADADFGLFGGRGADQQTDPTADTAGTAAAPAGPGAQPAGLFDPAFFQVGAGDNQPAAEPADDEDEEPAP
ncbi:hypothetical protein ACIBTV_27830 [Micromonospora sp. NPDC049366]|uniref:hypothetical protein n=1 Tax=Micromonospora sp. NPDC049366 TaxID=3364271 RepID=UPI0037B0414E